MRRLPPPQLRLKRQQARGQRRHQQRRGQEHRPRPHAVGLVPHLLGHQQQVKLLPRLTPLHQRHQPGPRLV